MTYPRRLLDEVRRTTLLRGWVNKGKKKGRDPYSRTPASFCPTPRSSKGGLTASAIKGVLLLRVDHPAGCRDGRLLRQRRIQLALASRLEVVAAVVVEIHPVLHYDLLAEVLRHIGRY